MPYKIHVEMTEGDSDGFYPRKLTLETTWESKHMAKLALARIREHYLWYKYHHMDKFHMPGEEAPPRPGWHAELGDEERNKRIICLPVESPYDNMMFTRFPAPWCGHFESLHGARIEEYEEGMAFRIGD